MNSIKSTIKFINNNKNKLNNKKIDFLIWGGIYT